MNDKLITCKNTRAIATKSLENALVELLEAGKPVSETDLRDFWLSKLQENDGIFPEGWYSPPPSGVAVLFATDSNPARISPKSLRPEPTWPQPNVFLDRTSGLMMLYASPVDRRTGIIGDFGVTLYLGANQETKRHFRQCLDLMRQVFDEVRIGMTFSEVAELGKRLFRKQGLESNLISITDPTGSNIGHTIPFTYEELNQEENGILHNGDDEWLGLKNMISTKRKFLNSKESLEIRPGMAFTIEPRLQVIGRPEIPVPVFHCIAIINDDGSKELITGFDRLFRLADKFTCT